MKRFHDRRTVFIALAVLVALTHENCAAGEPSQARPERFAALVTRVKDGDSLLVTQDDQQIDIRLEGIDCPELAQTFGSDAMQVALRLAQGKTVTIHPTGTDKYGRTLANVILPDDRNLSQELLRLGYAWWFRKYSNDQVLAELEAEARKEQRGLWARANPTAPWDWREQQRTKGRHTTVNVNVVPNGIEIVSLLPNPEGQDRGNEQVVIGNRNAAAVDLRGWILQDRARNVCSLSGTVPAKGELRVTMTVPSMPLNNDGDDVLLIDQGGTVRSQVAYGGYEVRPGRRIEFVAEIKRQK